MTTLKTITETAKEAKDSIEKLGRSAGRKLEEARDETGGALHTAASAVRTTANRLDATASYIEDHDLKKVFTGLQKFGRRHLTGSLVAVAAIGFFAGSAFSRMTHSCGKGPARGD